VPGSDVVDVVEEVDLLVVDVEVELVDVDVEVGGKTILRQLVL